MNPFEYVAVDSVEEALGVLGEVRGEAKVLAGGQSLVPLLNYRLARPRVVVDINGLPLSHVRRDDGRLVLGALVRHHVLEESEEIGRDCPVLRDAARLIGNVRVRSLGTVGGSLAHADPAGELPMVMTALDARMTIASQGGQRTVGVREFFTGPLATALGPDELLTGVDVPVMRDAGWAIEEMSRRAGDFAVVAVVALLRIDGRGRVDEARVAFGGVADRPVRAPAAEDLLTGHEPTIDLLQRAADAARDGVRPPSDAFVSGAYRRLLAGVLCRRALERAVTSALAVA